MHNLGVHYSEGLGVETDFSKATGYFERVTQMEHTNSIVGLAHLYQLGDGVEKDLNKMRYWLEQADNNNIKNDPYTLALFIWFRWQS